MVITSLSKNLGGRGERVFGYTFKITVISKTSLNHSNTSVYTHYYKAPFTYRKKVKNNSNNNSTDPVV